MNINPVDYSDVVLARKPKTASSSARAILRDANGKGHQAWGHHAARKLRALHPGKIIVGTERPPAPWYYSYWAHILRSGNPQWLYPFLAPRLRNEYGVNNFEACLFGMTHPDYFDDEEARRQGRGDPLGSVDLTGWKSGGLWSFLHEHYYCAESGAYAVDVLINTDRLNAGMAQLLGNPALLEAPKRGVHGVPDGWQVIYLPHMDQWVYNADHALMNLLDHKPWGEFPWQLRLMR